MKSYFKIVLFLLIAASVNGYAQTKTADSLKHILKIAKTDSVRMHILSDLTEYYMENNKDSTLYFLDQFIAIAKKNGKALDGGSISVESAEGESSEFIIKLPIQTQ